ncbi:MAG: hypothetical protein RLZZ30_177 [Bacteroidota bacterium]
MNKKILLLGSGELGKEFVIACQRYGQPLDRIVAKHQPDLIVPEIEAIRTERFYSYEEQGIQVVPSAKAANFTMNRKAIRDLAAKDLGVRTATYRYATSYEELVAGVDVCGIPCVVKPLMSSSGKGQSVIKSTEDIQKAWDYAMEGSRGDLKEVIVEGFIDFDYEITLLTVTQKDGPTLFCPPIGHRQERGDYQESWQPMPMQAEHLAEAQEMAAKVTAALGGAGIWGVEFFITKEGAYFSELSPRPHDTGMVTLAGTQNLSEFELHARAVLGLPIPRIEAKHNGASAVVLATETSDKTPEFVGVEAAMLEENTEVRIFGKPTTRPYRRMAVTLAFGEESVQELVEKAKKNAAKIQVK